MGITLHLTTNPGLEDVVEDEFRERAREAGLEVGEVVRSPQGGDGRVAVTVPAGRERALLVALGMRSIHHVLRPLDRFTLPDEGPLGFLRERVARLDFPEAHEAASFRATGIRDGEHAFTSMDAAREVGTAVQERHGLDVDLEDYDLEIRVAIEDRDCDVAVQYTPKALSKRGHRPYRARTALKANVAWAMLRLALGRDATPDAIVDPCCGSGTILLEAADLYPEARLIGGDRFERPARGCRRNLAHAGLEDRASVVQADARALATTFEGASFEAIITNPPFGVRLGRRIDFDDWYRAFLLACAGVLAPGGRLALLVVERGAFNRAIEQVGAMRIVHVRILGTGGVWPGLFVVERG